MADEPTEVAAEVVSEPDAPIEESVDTSAAAAETVADTPTDPAPEPVDEAPADSGEASPEPTESVPLTIAELDALPKGERIAYLREHVPEVANDLEYAGAQKRETELRRESGSRDATAARLTAIKAKLAEDPEGSDGDLNFMWDNAYANASHTNLSQITEAIGNSFEPTADERELLNQSAAQGDLTAYAQVMLTTAARNVGSKEVHSGTVSDIPADTPLAKSIRAEKEAFAVAEVEAARLETQEPREPAPATPVGSPAGAGTGVDPLLQKLEQHGRSALTSEEQNRARELLGLKRS